MYVGTHSSDTEETILAAFPKCTRQRSRGLCLCLSSQSSSWVGLISDTESRSNPRATGQGESKHSMSSLIGQGWAAPHLSMNPSAVTDWTRWAEPHLCLNPASCDTRAALWASEMLVGRRTLGGWTCSWGLFNHRLLWRAPSSPHCHDSTTHKSTKPPLLDKATQTSSLSLSNMKSGMWMQRCLIPALYELIWAGWRY